MEFAEQFVQMFLIDQEAISDEVIEVSCHEYLAHSFSLMNIYNTAHEQR